MGHFSAYMQMTHDLLIVGCAEGVSDSAAAAEGRKRNDLLCDSRLSVCTQGGGTLMMDRGDPEDYVDRSFIRGNVGKRLHTEAYITVRALLLTHKREGLSSRRIRT